MNGTPASLHQYRSRPTFANIKKPRQQNGPAGLHFTTDAALAPARTGRREPVAR
jgi:hypothetical protein